MRSHTLAHRGCFTATGLMSSAFRFLRIEFNANICFRFLAIFDFLSYHLESGKCR
jgi:hypothetical protein